MQIIFLKRAADETYQISAPSLPLNGLIIQALQHPVEQGCSMRFLSMKRHTRLITWVIPATGEVGILLSGTKVKVSMDDARGKLRHVTVAVK